MHSTTFGLGKAYPKVPQRNKDLLPHVQREHLTTGDYVAIFILCEWRKHALKDMIPRHDVRVTCGMVEQAPIYIRTLYR